MKKNQHFFYFEVLMDHYIFEKNIFCEDVLKKKY